MREETQKYIYKAKDCLQDAEVLLAGQRWAGVINRSYYAVYDCIQASDYDPDSEFTETDVTEVLSQSYAFLEATKNYLENKI